jgi:hypothetical protein
LVLDEVWKLKGMRGRVMLGEENVTHILLNCQETKRCRENIWARRATNE